MARRLAGLTAVAALGAAGCGAAGDRPLVSTSPGLQPAFSRGVPDYVTRCAPGRPVTIDVDERDGLTVDAKASVTLREGQAFRFTVTGNGRTTTHHVRCLPRDFPGYVAKVAGDREAAFHLVTPAGNRSGNYAVLFDANGVPVWWLRRDYPPWDAHVTPDGNIAFSRQTVNFGKDPDLAYDEVTLEDEPVREWKTVGSPTDAHEFFPLANGNAMMLTYVRRDGVDLREWGGDRDAYVYDTEIHEVRPDGSLAWRWRARDHLDIGESERWFKADRISTGWDLQHGNSVAVDGDGGVLFSARYPDAVYRIDKRSGRITWKLGGYETPESLKGLDAGILGGQHDVRVLNDGTITIYDNANNRGHPPRALRFRVDARARTAEVLDKIEDPSIQGGSHCCGSARKLPRGHWVIGWGGTAVTTETTAAGKPVFRLTFKKHATYRAEPVLPGVLSRERLRAAMDARQR